MQSMQVAGYQLMLDRKLGDYELPPGWKIMAAGNRTTDRAVAYKQSTALKSRMAHLTFDVDLEEWVSWAYSQNVVSELIAFIRFRPNLLHDMEDNKDKDCFPTPRGWEFVNRVLTNLPRSHEMDTISSIVGPGAGGEFVAFRRIWQDLPDIDKIIKDPAKAPIPKETATLYALTVALAERAAPKTFTNIIKYVKRLQPEYQVITIRDSVHHVPELGKTKEFTDWAIENSDVLMK
jgi:hypothetical protein